MRIAPTTAEARALLGGGGEVAFVPTMGKLHSGHLALVRIARSLAPRVAASIFVNRLQFAPHEDFERYPRTFADDCASLEALGVDVVFAPDEQELYPRPPRVLVEPPPVADTLEGEIRMLLSHTAGFQAGTWPYGRGRDWEPFEPTTWSQLVAMMPYQELLFRPGSRYSYSNPAYVYLARVVEAITGDPWEAYVQKNIFAPLRLDRSYFNGTPYHLAEDLGRTTTPCAPTRPRNPSS